MAGATTTSHPRRKSRATAGLMRRRHVPARAGMQLVQGLRVDGQLADGFAVFLRKRVQGGQRTLVKVRVPPRNEASDGPQVAVQVPARGRRGDLVAELERVLANVGL